MQIEKDILRRIQNIGQFSSKGIRAPHTPLLLLLAISKAAAGEERRIYFSDVEGAFVSPASRCRHPRPVVAIVAIKQLPGAGWCNVRRPHGETQCSTLMSGVGLSGKYLRCGERLARTP